MASDAVDLWTDNKRLSQSCLSSVRCRGISALEIAAEQVTTTHRVTSASHSVMNATHSETSATLCVMCAIHSVIECHPQCD